MNAIPFIQAAHFTAVPLDSPRDPRVIVIHSMEAPDKPGTAEMIAHYFATTDREASAHYCIDPEAVVQCVQMKDVAYGAKGFNRLGIQLEHAGYARETFKEWTSEEDLQELKLSAQLCREIIIPKYRIQAQWLTVTQLRNIANNRFVSGFVTHADVTVAFKISGGHTDPGQNFPKDLYMDLVRNGNGS